MAESQSSGIGGNDGGFSPWSLLATGIQDTINLGWSAGQWVYNHNEGRRKERREDTAAQRYAKDLQLAGLSKTLAAGGQAHTMAPVTSNGGPGMSGGADAITAGVGIELAYKNMQLQERLNTAQVAKLDAETDLLNRTTPLRETQITAETDRTSALAKQTKIENEGLGQRLNAQLDNIITQTKHTRGKILLLPYEKNQIDAITSKTYADIRHIEEQIRLDIQRGKQIKTDIGIKQLDALRDLQKNLRLLKTGNMDKSFLGKIATDMANLGDIWGRYKEGKEYAEAFRQIAERVLNNND